MGGAGDPSIMVRLRKPYYPGVDWPSMEDMNELGDTYVGNDGIRRSIPYKGINVPDAEELIVSDTGGMKGQKDVRLHAIPVESLKELGRVNAFGEDKYGDYNFRQGYRWSLGFDALQRHSWDWWNRESYDRQSRLHHLAHAAWHCLVLMFFELTGRGEDDRPT